MGESAQGPRSTCSVTLAARNADRRFTVLVRLTATKQLTLPDKLLTSFPGVDCFSAGVEDGSCWCHCARDVARRCVRSSQSLGSARRM